MKKYFMHKNYLAVAAFFGAFAVGLGAFGAHGLERMTNDEKILHGFQTGVQYQMYHALALLLIALFYEKLPGKWVKRAGICFIAGIILFSGSLYLITFLKIQESDAVKFAGPVTPLGGVFLIAGWVCLLLSAKLEK